MRIDTISIENLASLLGQQHVIDLRNPTSPLNGAGLIAITGPTGAGKSTILDAVCLALFGLTPRQPRGVDPSSLVSRTATHGKVDLGITLDDGTPWRVTWSIRRARGRIDGEFQAPQRDIFDPLTDSVLASGASEVSRLVTARLHLTLDQFRSIVLLAQGEFARFLSADDNHRARLLELLTGTDIYAQLGKAAHDAWRILEQECSTMDAALEQIHVLDDAALGQLKSHQIHIDQTVTQLAEQRTHRHHERDCLLNCQRIESHVLSATEAVQTSRAAIAAAALEYDKRRLANAALALATPLEAVHQAVRRSSEQHITFERNAETAVVLRATHADSLRESATLVGFTCATATALVHQARQVKSLAELPQTQLAELHTLCMSVRSKDAEVVRVNDLTLRLRAELREAHLTVEVARALHKKTIALHTDAQRACDRETEFFSKVLLGSDIALTRSRHEQLIEARTLLAESLPDLTVCRDEFQQAEMVRLQAEVLANRDTQAAELATSAVNAQVSQIERLQALSALADHVHLLQPDSPCPLCGSKDHPAPLTTVDHVLGQAQKELIRLRSINESVQTNAKKTSRQANDEANRAALIRATQHSFELRISEHERRWTPLAKAMGLTGVPLASARSAIELAYQASTQLLSKFEHGQKTVEHLRSALQATTEEVHAKTTHLKSLEHGYSLLFDHVTAADTAHNLAKAARGQASSSMREAIEKVTLLVHESVDTVADFSTWIEQLPTRCEHARQLMTLATQAERDADDVTRVWNSLNSIGMAIPCPDLDSTQQWVPVLSRARASLQNAQTIGTQLTLAQQSENISKRACDEALIEQATREAALVAAMDTSPFSSRAAIEAARLSKNDYEQLDVRLKGLDAAQAATTETLVRSQNERTIAFNHAYKLGLKPEDPASLEQHTTVCTTIDTEFNALLEQKGETYARLQLDLDAHQRREKLLAGQTAVRRLRVRADRLKQCIGDASGSRFSRFAQTLTLDLLLDLANRRLVDLAPRYQLQREPGHVDGQSSLALRVIDHDQADSERSVSTLSGGETFLASLALALALADLHRGQSRMGTLCIDEGFGSLDEQTLAIAMTTLERLQQSQGTQILLISHVGALHERISHRIEVIRRGSGASWIRLVGPDAVLDRLPDLPLAAGNGVEAAVVEASILALISEHGPLSASDMKKIGGLEKLSLTLASLIKRGQLTKSGPGRDATYRLHPPP